jgi:hypothetical protein
VGCNPREGVREEGLYSLKMLSNLNPWEKPLKFLCEIGKIVSLSCKYFIPIRKKGKWYLILSAEEAPNIQGHR